MCPSAMQMALAIDRMGALREDECVIGKLSTINTLGQCYEDNKALDGWLIGKERFSRSLAEFRERESGMCAFCLATV